MKLWYSATLNAKFATAVLVRRFENLKNFGKTFKNHSREKFVSRNDLRVTFPGTILHSNQQKLRHELFPSREKKREVVVLCK